MIQKFSERVWFGNWTSPQESIDGVSPAAIINVAHNFSERRGRNKYWENLSLVDWRIPYLRCSLRDKDRITDKEVKFIRSFSSLCLESNCLPILCHCQMGGHRGPSTAMLVEWFLSFEMGGEELVSMMLEIKPGLRNARPGGYWFSVVDLITSD